MAVADRIRLGSAQDSKRFKDPFHKEAMMNLYVGNISPSVQHAELLHMFEGTGQVLYARLGESKTDAGDKGYAFVYVPNEEHARTVVASLNGTLLKGEKLTVSPMAERPCVVGGGAK
jgi:RNA recognition motif-containing protein